MLDFPSKVAGNLEAFVMPDLVMSIYQVINSVSRSRGSHGRRRTDARPVACHLNDWSEEDAATQSFHLFGAFAVNDCRCDRHKASCLAGERMSRWPFACGGLIAGVLYSPCRLLRPAMPPPTHDDSQTFSSYLL